MITNSISTLIYKKKDSKDSVKPLAVLTGYCRAGKTTLYNKLCNTSRIAGAGLESMTRDLSINSVEYGRYAMELIDTPGNNSTEETYKHAYLLHACLTSKKINTIFVVMKYENRFSEFKNILDNQLQFLQNYENKIVVMISHWDHANNPAEEFGEICKTFEEYEISNIICYSNQCDNNELADLMHSCASNMEAQEIVIPKKEFFMNFNILDQKSQIKQQFQIFSETTKILYEDFCSALKENQWLPTPDDGKDELLGLMIIQFREELNKILTDFQKKCYDEMVNLDYYTLSIKMEKENIALCDKFVNLVNKHMSWDYFNKMDPRNLIKRCPYCQEIWFKSGGCENETQCGNVDSSGFFYDMKSLPAKPWYKFKIIYEGKTLKWVKQEKENVNINQVGNNSLSNDNKEKKVAQKRGCGQKIDWKNLPRLEEKLFLELFGTKSTDDLNKMVDDDKFVKIRENIEKEININI